MPPTSPKRWVLMHDCCQSADQWPIAAISPGQLGAVPVIVSSAPHIDSKPQSYPRRLSLKGGGLPLEGLGVPPPTEVNSIPPPRLTLRSLPHRTSGPLEYTTTLHTARWTRRGRGRGRQRERRCWTRVTCTTLVLPRLLSWQHHLSPGRQILPLLVTDLPILPLLVTDLPILPLLVTDLPILPLLVTDLPIGECRPISYLTGLCEASWLPIRPFV